MAYIDSHVHLRDEWQEAKETIAHGLSVAAESGVLAVFDMPNTDPVVDTEARALERIALARAARVPGVFYGTYLGLKDDIEQINRAAAAVQKHEQIVGIKLYAGHSTGNLGIIGLEPQERVYSTLAAAGYDGVLFVHAEKESALHKHLWNPEVPHSHCLARPAQAELESVRDQIMLVKQTGFRGKLHIAHISTDAAVGEVVQYRNEGGRITCGVCPHHLMYDWSIMQTDPDGIMWKVNPPLRAPGEQSKLVERLRVGDIAFLETDHAPHTLADKTTGTRDTGYASGIAGLPHWPLFEEFLVQQGFTPSRIDAVTYSAALDLFDLDVTRKEAAPRRDRSGDYINCYKDADRLLRKPL